MLKRLFKGVFENIKAEKGTFFSSIVSFMLIFSLINIFVFGAINLDSYRLKAEQSNQVIAYLKDITEEEKSGLQTKLLEINGVSSVRYISKDVALKSIEKELNVDLSSEPNPLEDAFFIYLNKNVNADDLQNKLTELNEIDSLDLRAKVINQTVAFSNNLDSFIKYACIALGAFALIMLYNISVANVKTRKTEIYRSLIKGEKRLFIRTTFFIESLIAILISGVASYYAYTYIREGIIELVKNSTLENVVFSTMDKEIYVLCIVLALTVLLSLIINYLTLGKYFKKSYYEKLYEDEAEELEEAYEDKIVEESKEKEEKAEEEVNEIEKLKEMLKLNEEKYEDFEDLGEEE